MISNESFDRSSPANKSWNLQNLHSSKCYGNHGRRGVLFPNILGESFKLCDMSPPALECKANMPSRGERAAKFGAFKEFIDRGLVLPCCEHR